MGHKRFAKSASDGKTYSNPTPSLILIMSTSTSAPSDVQLTPEAQAFFEHILNQKLKERDEYYLLQIQEREKEVEASRALREQEFQADIAAHRVTLESVSHQLEKS